MSKGQTKKTREAAGNRRKLTRAEKKQIAEAIRKAKGDGKARTAQQTIPYLAMYPDGICKVTEKRYSKCVVFEDINYQLAQADDKTAIFARAVDEGKAETRLGDSLKYIKKNEVHVIDIAKLSEDKQAYVFGDAVRTLYNLQLGEYNGDEGVVPPSRIVIFIDELNKYASKDAPRHSPILQQILDVAERGRSLGVVLFAAEQFRSAIHDRVTGNCSTHAYGRTNSIEVTKSDYKSVPSVYKTMMTRLKQGEYIVQNPIFRSMLHIKFPKPIYKQIK